MSPASLPPVGESYRVLVADDDPSCRECLAILLDRDGFSVQRVAGGGEALERLRRPVPRRSIRRGVRPRLPFDFLVLDHNMPDLSGVEVLRRVRIEFGEPLPAILVSGEKDRELERIWYAEGGFGLLPKPIEPADFRNEVRSLVERFFGA